MTKKLKVSLIGLLSALMCFALAFGLWLGFKPAYAATVTLDKEEDFTYSEDGVLSGLSDDGMAKIADAAEYSVVVPEGVTEITEGVFAGLSGMTSLTVPFVGKSATPDVSKGEGVFSYIFGTNAFIGASKTEQAYSGEEWGDGETSYNPELKRVDTYSGFVPYLLKEVTVTGGALTHGAFSNCANIEKVTLSEIETVGDLAFYQSGIREIELGDVTAINKRAFQYAANLTEINLSKVTSIGYFTFANSGLISVELPSELGENLGYFAFFQCERLVKVKVNDGVVIPGSEYNDAFDSSYRIAEVIDLRTGDGVDTSADFWKGGYNLIGDNIVVKTENDGESNLVEKDGYVFFKLSDDSWSLIEYIGTEKQLVLPDAEGLAEYGIEKYSILMQCFNYTDRNFVEVQIPSCVTNIGAAAFLNSGVIKVTVGEYREDGNYPQISYIYNATFWNCKTIREVFIYSSYEATNQNGDIVNPIFGYTDYVDYDYENGQWIIDYIYLDNVNLYNAAKGGEELESKISIAGDCVFFKGNDSLELMAYVGGGGAITLPNRDTVKSLYPESDGSYKIGDGIFAGNSDITGVVIPEAVTEIGAFVFQNASGLINVSIEGGNLIKIGQEAFVECRALSAISIPDSVEYIGTAAFRYCSSLLSVNLPASLKDWGKESLLGGISTDTGMIFYGCSNLTSVTIPAGITVIPKLSFSECSSLTSVTFAAGSKLETIEDTAFANTALTSFVLPASVKTVDYMVFKGVSGLKQFYIEEGSQLTSLGNVFTGISVKESLHIANVDLTNNNTAFGNLPVTSNTTVFLPKGADTTLAGKVTSAKLIVVLDKETYDNLMSSSFSSKNKLYWQTEVAFEITDTLDHTYRETQDKLASNSGASIKYVLTKDAGGRPYSWAIDDNYSLPSIVGSNVVDSTQWLVDGGELTTEATINSDGLVYTMAGAVEARIAAPSNMRIEYTYEEYIPEFDNLVYVRTTDMQGNPAEAIDVGSYYIYVRPADGAVWDIGGTNERAFTLEIYKKTVTLDWYYNLNDKIGSDGVYDVTYFSELTAELFTAKYSVGDRDVIALALNRGISVAKDGEAPSNINYLSEGLYRFYATHKNYEFTNASILVRVDPIEVNLGNLTYLNWQSQAGSLGSGTVYIHNDGNKQVLHSLPHPDTVYQETVNARLSVVRYTGDAITISLATRSEYSVNQLTDNSRTDAGVYTATATLTANSNFLFTTSLENQLSQYGMTVTVSPDGKTATVTKVWYIVEIDNELLDSAKSIEAGNWVLYKFPDWTFGETVEISLPRLAHGDEADGWEDSTGKVTFDIFRNDTRVATDVDRTELKDYVNDTMPAGNYRLVMKVGFNLTGGEHAHWWDEAEHDSTSMGTVYQDFEREYEFSVTPATVVLEGAEPDNLGYINYEWDLSGSKSGFFKDFVEFVEEKISLTEVTPSDKWSGVSYGTYKLTYNFARMNNDRYYEATDSNLTDLIEGGAEGTYKVLFRITADNHKILGSETRYAYFFTVTVYENLDTPDVSSAGLVYTGSKVLPDIPEKEQYETIWSDDDDYVASGTHSVSFKLYDPVHYRWKTGEGETVTVNFTIAKANIEWTVATNIIRWSYGSFDKSVNLITGQVDGGTVSFKITDKDKKDITNLTDIKLVAVEDESGNVLYYTVNDTVAEILKGLDAGKYYLTATVTPDGNHNNTLAQEIEFEVAKAPNDWKDTFNIIEWSYGSYDEDTNRILGSTVYGTVTFSITKGGTAITGLEAFTEVDEDIAERLGGLAAGEDYVITATVTVDNNHMSLKEQSIPFKVAKAPNGWKDAFDIIEWSYGSFSKDTNRILGSTVYGTVTFSITKGGTVITGLEAFTEVDEDIAERLGGLAAGEDYKVTATVTVDNNHMPLDSLSINFEVEKAPNEWQVSPHIIAWQYGEFSADLNLVLAQVTYGKIFVKFTDDKNVAITDEFELAESGIVPESVADVLKGLDKGDYKLVVRVKVESNYEEITDLKPVPFSVSPLNNDWLVSPSVIQWQFGGFDASTNLILGTAKQGVILFTVTDKDGKALTDSFSLTDGKVPANVATILAGLAKGDYKVTAKVTESGNYTALNATAQFSVLRAVNSWDRTLSITTWTVGKFNAEENVIDVKAKFGEVTIRIVDSTDTEKEPYYEGLLGTEELNKVLADLKVGTYQLTAKVAGTDDYFDIVAESILFEVFEKPGLPWWAVMLIVVGALGVAALILWILHEKGILQMLTGKIIIAMRTKMTVDATIAAVRANKRAEEAKKSIAKAEAQDRLEALKKAREEERNRSPEERAAALEEKAAAHAAKAEKSQKRAERLQKQASRLKNVNGETIPEESADTAETQPVDVAENEVAAADVPTNNTDEE